MKLKHFYSCYMFSEPKQLVKVQIITELLNVLNTQFNTTNLQHFAIISLPLRK